MAATGLLSFGARAEQATFRGLGDLPGGQVQSYAWGVSPNGRFVVGQGHIDGGTAAYVWSEANGMIALPDLPGAADQGWARGSTDDGRFFGGFGYPAGGGQEPVRWVDGAPEGLGRLDGGELGVTQAISADGSVCVGHAAYRDGEQSRPAPFRWENGVMVNVGTPRQNGVVEGQALGVTPDGLTVVRALRAGRTREILSAPAAAHRGTSVTNPRRRPHPCSAARPASG